MGKEAREVITKYVQEDRGMVRGKGREDIERGEEGWRSRRGRREVCLPSVRESAVLLLPNFPRRVRPSDLSMESIR